KAAFTARYDALVKLLGEVATESEIARPSDVGTVRAFVRNTRKLTRVLGAEGPLGTLGVLLAGGILAVRERALLTAVLGRLLRTHPGLPFGRGPQRLAA